ncbi:MAG TPA: lipopolysaccharide heptosyltransferase II [Blastocatellia bacterium]|jgi:heptosyltransferase-2|nr:lipopolysaccharide heptosyltransferase II [Blastocatellia bacterium]
MELDSIKRVMVRAPNWVGDAVMAEPALREIRRIFSGARITMLARPWVAGLFEGEDLADDLIAVRDARGLTQSVSRFFRESSQVRRERFDLAVLLQNAFGAALIARAGRVRMIAGYPSDGRRALLDLVVPFDADYRTDHQVSYYARIAAEVERRFTGTSLVPVEAARPRLRATGEQVEWARRLLAQAGASAGAIGDRPIVAVGDRPIVALNPGATNSRAKQWLAGRFAETADRLAERDGFQTIIVGAEGDREAAEETASSMRTPALMLAGRTSISELKGALACSSLVISNDTGPAHVSSALGIPTVVVFGPTEHFATRPLSDAAVVVRHDVECSPCMYRDCPIDHRCMTRVEVDDVYLAARDLLARAAR